MTKIDIILPYFNGSKYIKEQLDSILNSNLQDIELNIILINDASSASDTEYLRTILPSKITYIENEKNLGVIKTVEKGLSLSTAPYVMFCDQDDVWLPNKIQHSLAKIKESETGNRPTLVYSDLEISGPNLEKLHPSMQTYYQINHATVKPSILFHNVVTGCTVIMNQALVKIGLPFPENITMHDHWFAICATFAGEIVQLNETTILYRQHGRNQVGTPNRSIIQKLINYKTTFPKFQRHLQMKIEMTSALSKRLSDIGNLEESIFLQTVVKAINEKDIFYLIKVGVIHGSLARIVAIGGLLLALKRIEK